MVRRLNWVGNSAVRLIWDSGDSSQACSASVFQAQVMRFDDKHMVALGSDTSFHCGSDIGFQAGPRSLAVIYYEKWPTESPRDLNATIEALTIDSGINPRLFFESILYGK